MEKLFNGISMGVAVIGGFLVHFLGSFDILLKTIVVLVILDYVTGILKAVYLKEISSEIGFKGILKKIMMFVVICFAYVMQQLLGDKIPLREIVILFYIANEGLSLLENAAVFLPIPDKLKDVLLQLRDKNKGDNSNEQEK